jgi:hypothetical protein
MEYLDHFGIKVPRKAVKFKTFFGIPIPKEYGEELPESGRDYVHKNVTTCLDIGTIISKGRNRIVDIKKDTTDRSQHAVRRFYSSLHTLAVRYPDVETCTDAFVDNTLDMLGFNHIDPNVSIIPGTSFKLPISGVNKRARPDVLVEYTTEVGGRSVLLIHEDKNMVVGAGVRHHAVPQLVAEAIAVFISNNPAGSSIQEEVMYGVTMLGTTPRFYKIPITRELVDLVESGKSAKTWMEAKNGELLDKDPIMCKITWCNPVMGDTYQGNVGATSVASNRSDFKRYLRSYEALRRLVTARFKEISKDDLIFSDVGTSPDEVDSSDNDEESTSSDDEEPSDTDDEN